MMCSVAFVVLGSCSSGDVMAVFPVVNSAREHIFCMFVADISLLCVCRTLILLSCCVRFCEFVGRLRKQACGVPLLRVFV
jgi:hypothetical protein